ncbi:hypothetical protein MNBD_GAMMA03-1183 [hydrothermal vent metagenome]|uniref:Uncharacterized protein n=1 Tax=hydrothermal vent metagenome TaxID=652676 RepID=A0A3B0WPL0_9ZZZZ
MKIKSFITFVSFVAALSGFGLVYAVDGGMGSEESNNRQKASQLKTVFLSKETREKIDRQRMFYLNPVVEKKSVKLLPKGTGTSVAKKKRIYIPPKVNVSLVMVKPDGSRLVRVNDKYNRSPSKHIKMDFSNSTSKGVPVNVQGRTQVIPVGSTLFTRKNKIVKTYKSEQAKRKKAAPKSKQKAVKERLKQVQILKPK